MRRVAALRLLGGILTASLAGCAGDCAIESAPPLKTANSVQPQFGAQIYAVDDVQRAIGLIAGCGGSLVRIGVNGDFDFADAVFAAAARHAMRVVILTDFHRQPVDIASFASSQAAIQERYARYDPIWEVWNEPNLAQYWGATPDVSAYAKLAIETATALRAAGAHDVWSGGTSGVDIDWIWRLKARAVYEVMNGCAVHSYEDPCTAYSAYTVLAGLVPSSVGIHTTETCIADASQQAEFLRSMWFIHRDLGLPTMIWCELRDGTAGTTGQYTLPYGLVDKNYVPKPSYRMAELLAGASTFRR